MWRVPNARFDRCISAQQSMSLQHLLVTCLDPLPNNQSINAAFPLHNTPWQVIDCRGYISSLLARRMCAFIHKQRNGRSFLLSWRHQKFLQDTSLLINIVFILPEFSSSKRSGGIGWHSSAMRREKGSTKSTTTMVEPFFRSKLLRVSAVSSLLGGCFGQATRFWKALETVILVIVISLTCIQFWGNHLLPNVWFLCLHSIEWRLDRLSLAYALSRRGKVQNGVAEKFF